MNRTRHMYSLWGVVFALCLFAAVPDAFALHPFSPTYKRTSQIVDQKGLLKDKVKSSLLATADDAEYYTDRQMIIMVIPSFGRWQPHIYAMSAAKRLGMGVEKSGAILVVSRDDRNAYIGVSPGLERIVNGRVIQNILKHEIFPELEKGDFQQAVLNGAGALAEAFDGNYKTPAEKRKQYLPFAILIPVLILMKVIFGKGQGRNFFGGGAWKRW